MTRPSKPWADRAPVEAVTHEPQPSGLLEAFNRLPVPDVRESTDRAAHSLDGMVRLDAIATDLLAHAEAHGAAREGVAPGVVRTIADALDQVAPGRVSLGGVVLIEAGVDDSDWNAAAYRWPDSFTGWAHIERGSVEDCTVLAALAVGVALWGRLPTADEVAAWMDEDEPAGGGCGGGVMPTYRVNADFLVCMSVEVEADSPEQAAAEFNDFPSIPCGVDYDLGDTAPRYIAVCDAETGDTLHEEDYQ